MQTSQSAVLHPNQQWHLDQFQCQDLWYKENVRADTPAGADRPVTPYNLYANLLTQIAVVAQSSSADQQRVYSPAVPLQIIR